MLFLSALIENLVKLLMYSIVVILGVLTGKKIKDLKSGKPEKK